MKTTLAFVMGFLAMTTASSADPLDAMLWKARPVVLVAPSASDHRLEAQQKLFAAEANALRGYDIRVLTLTGDDSARQRWHVGRDDFAVILVGKDGGEKARWSAPVDPARIFAEIDVMPMRKQEVRQR